MPNYRPIKKMIALALGGAAVALAAQTTAAPARRPGAGGRGGYRAGARGRWQREFPEWGAADTDAAAPGRTGANEAGRGAATAKVRLPPSRQCPVQHCGDERLRSRGLRPIRPGSSHAQARRPRAAVRLRAADGPSPATSIGGDMNAPEGN